jgi:hypothetical protein
MNRTSKLVNGLCLVHLAALAGCGTGADSALDASPAPAAGDTSATDDPLLGQVVTDEQIAAMSPETQSIRLDPLRAIAEAVGEAGRGSLADIYGSLIIDANHELVEVYVTDPGQEGRVLALATQIDASIDTARVRIKPARYTRDQLVAASEQIMNLAEAGRLPYHVYTVGPMPDASGVQVEVDDTSQARLMTPSVAGAMRGAEAEAMATSITFQPGHALKAKSWAQQKWSDSAPFIGGDALTTSGHGWGCTAGLPAVRTSNNQPVMVTAAHCFGVGSQVYTMGGTAGHYNNGLKGHWVGQVTQRYNGWDAALIVGANNNADVSGTTTWRPLTSTAYSYNGDYVCHAGQRSFFMGHPTPCNIKVTNQDKLCGPTTGCPGLHYTVRGVWGRAVNNGWGAADGDSGATMFVIKAGTARQARGVLSDGDPGDGAPGVFWSEAVDIFRYYHLKLNPHQ